MKRCHKKLKAKRKVKKLADRKRKRDIRKAASLEHKAAHKKKYYDYLGSDKWRDIRNKVIKLSNSKCQKCGSGSNLQVHHITYKNIFKEKLRDLMLVCERCHMEIHNIPITGLNWVEGFRRRNY